MFVVYTVKVVCIIRPAAAELLGLFLALMMQETQEIKPLFPENGPLERCVGGYLCLCIVIFMQSMSLYANSFTDLSDFCTN